MAGKKFDDLVEKIKHFLKKENVIEENEIEKIRDYIEKQEEKILKSKKENKK